MIRGIGTDIIDSDRIKNIVARHGNRFLKKVFTSVEIEFCQSKADQTLHFAARWAAKEAFYKALPSSCQPVSSWKSIQIISEDGTGKPLIDISSRTLMECLQREKIRNLHLSISHEKTYCVAFVVLE
jgi:holo-[acyl-carrier protein] synthase